MKGTHYDIVVGDCLDTLRTMPDESVNCVVTSPPYYGLRDYGPFGRVWDDSPCCTHVWGDEIAQDSRHVWTASNSNKEGVVAGCSNSNKEGVVAGCGGYPTQRGRFCGKCTAWFGCLGLEPSPVLYVSHLVQVFREIRRVLRKNGVCWLNLGDSYGNSSKWGGSTSGKHVKALHGASGIGREKRNLGVSDKNLLGVPWRTALALQHDGWTLRSEVIWHKNNCMPESVKDRPNRAHEHMFLLTKHHKYWYNHEAVQEEAVGSTKGAAASFKRDRSKRAESVTPVPGTGTHRQDRPYVEYSSPKRNLRSVWTLSSTPFRGAHFAVMPEALAEPCILAGCPENGLVLDPFGGSGTTAVVALRHKRHALLLEANPDYAKLAEQRISDSGVQPW